MARRKCLSLVLAATVGLCSISAARPVKTWPTFVEGVDTDEMTPLYREGDKLMEEGLPYKALAFNRLDLLAGPASLGPVARYRSYLDLRSWQAGYLMQAVAAGVKVVRVAAYQSLFGPHGTDFRALDQLLHEALALDMRVALVLETHEGIDSQPEGQDKDLGWYHSGYRSPYGGYRHSFLAHIGHVARRYAGHPAIAWWEVIDKACLPGHAGILSSMVHESAKALKVYDSNHLVAAGSSDWEDTHDSDFVDLLTVTDAGTDRDSFPRVTQAAQQAGEQLGRPVIVVSSALSLHSFDKETRALEYHKRMLWVAEQDMAVFGLYHYDALPLHRDSFGIEAGDPVIGAVRAAALREYAMPDGRMPHLIGEADAVERAKRAKQPWWHVFRRAH